MAQLVQYALPEPMVLPTMPRLASVGALAQLSVPVHASKPTEPVVAEALGLAVHSTGKLYLYRGNRAGQFKAANGIIGSGWDNFTSVVSSGDFNGDGLIDVITRKTDGTLLLYRGNGAGGAPSAPAVVCDEPGGRHRTLKGQTVRGYGR